MLILWILLLIKSFFALKDSNMLKILIKGFSVGRFSDEKTSLKDLELKIDNPNYFAPINNSLNHHSIILWKLKLKLRRKEIEFPHKYPETGKNYILRNSK